MRHLATKLVPTTPAGQDFKTAIAAIRSKFQGELHDLESQKEELKILEIQKLAELPDPLSRR